VVEVVVAEAAGEAVVTRSVLWRPIWRTPCRRKHNCAHSVGAGTERDGGSSVRPSTVACRPGTYRARLDGRSVPLLPAGVAALREGAVGPGVVFPEATKAAALQLWGHLAGGARWRPGLPEATTENRKEVVCIWGAELPRRVGSWWG